MAVKIRLARTGRKKLCRYRVVAADSRMRRDGRCLETLGTYNPQADPKEFTIKTDKVAYWINKGAQPTETVHNLLKQDRFFEKVEALGKGLDAETLNVERKPERKRKPKGPKKAKSE
ncbi:MAG: 30S ribosomal protein S16 [Chitinivibrionales bacterium]|nr:30S ribosomal protein S16 [Chitinivibrionales bacterium]